MKNDNSEREGMWFNEKKILFIQGTCTYFCNFPQQPCSNVNGEKWVWHIIHFLSTIYFAKAFDFLTLGTWNYLFQTMLVVALMVIKGRFEIGYVFSFGVGVIFGKMIDFHYMWLSMIPVNFGMQILYFLLGFICLAVGICFANNCSMPIIPTDLFPRDFSELTSVSYKKVKTIFDLSCLTVTVVISSIILKKITGIGIGTVVCAFTMGKAISIVQTGIDKRIIFKSYIFNRSLNNF